MSGAINWTQEQYNDWLRMRSQSPSGFVAEKERAAQLDFEPDPHSDPRKMNKWEGEYAQLLDLRKRAGEILWYEFESIKLRLADATFYTPDFAVVTALGELQLHEVKGFVRDDAIVKFKVAAEQFPCFRWLMLRKEKNGEWEVMRDVKKGIACATR